MSELAFNGLTKEDLNIPIKEERDIQALVAKKLSKNKKFVKYIEERYETPLDAEWVQKYSFHFEMETFERLGLNKGEIFLMQNAASIYGPLSKSVEDDHFVSWLRKIENSWWRWGYKTPSIAQIIKTHKALMDFEFGEGFEVRYDFTTSCNQVGRARHHSDYLYIDGTIALCIYYKGNHVLTIGLSPSHNGILVSQIQLRNKKGNRWLFKIDNLFEYTMKRIHKAFSKHRIPVYVMQGESVIEALYASYNPEAKPDKEDKEGWEAISNRLVSFYNQSMTKLKRGAEIDKRIYVFTTTTVRFNRVILQ